MKKITLFLFVLLLNWQIKAQVSSYAFTNSLGTYVENSAAATALADVRADTYLSSAQNIGFNFVYDGLSRTQFKMSSNGFISFNMVSTNSLNTNNFSSENAPSRPIIAPLWDDLDGDHATSSATYEVTGTAPNRVLTVEWRNWEWNYFANNAVISFQVKLYETTNVIEFVYRQEANPINGTGSASIGIGSSVGSGSGSFLNLTSIATPVVSSATPVININTKPATGQIYRFTPPTCIAPAGFNTDLVTINSANISWVGTNPAPTTGYEYYYSTVNSAPVGAGTPVSGVTASITGLNAFTTYYVWLRSDCSTGDFSTWNGPFTFTTSCAAVTDFVQGFETTTGTAFPNCWAKVGTLGTADTRANTAISGARLMYIFSTAIASRPVVAMVPVSNANAGTHRMVMKVRANNTIGETIELGYLTNAVDATTFVPINSILTNSTTVPQLFVTIPSGLPAGDIVFALRTGTKLASVLIDDVTWEPIPAVVPTCSTITSPLTGATNVVNSTVTWTASIDASAYYLNVGYNTGSTEVFNLQNVGNVTSFTIPTEPSSDYYVTVIPYNSFGQAVGCSEISFTTCDVLLAPFIETFQTFLPTCWSNMQGGDLITGPIFSTGSGWVDDGFANIGNTGSIKNEIYTTGANDWVISPIVSIPASGYELKLDAAATQWGTNDAPTTAWEADDYIQVLVSNSGTNNWTVLHTYDNTNQPSNTGTTLIVGLNTYAGQEVRFALRAFEGTDNGAADIDFSIDNFEVRLTPSTVPVCATNILATPDINCGNYTNVITWNSVLGADGYTITIGTTPGGSEVVNNVNIGNILTYSFVGNPSTNYYYNIVPFNAAGPAVGCLELSFTTNTNGCYCPSTPTSVDGAGINNVQVGSTNFPNTVNVSPVYSDNSASPVDVQQGQNANVQVTLDTYDSFGVYEYNVYVWVDYNNDLSFDSSELVFTGLSSPVTPAVVNASFMIPASAQLGLHRMRVLSSYYFLSPLDPCYSGQYGETVDFNLNVLATASANSFDNASFVSFPNPVKDVFNLSYTSEISSVRVLNLLGQEVVSKAVNATSTQVDMSQLSAGTYIVNVTLGDSIKSIKVIKQ